MSSLRKLFDAACANPGSITFSDLKRIVKGAGFAYRRNNGDHEVYGKEGVPEIINLQPRKKDKRMAKEYQVEQVVDIINKYGIEVE